MSFGNIVKKSSSRQQAHERHQSVDYRQPSLNLGSKNGGYRETIICGTLIEATETTEGLGDQLRISFRGEKR